MAETLFETTIAMTLGPDLGQCFGTVFEAVDDQGAAVCGAGFTDVYNSVFRSDRLTLQFYVRQLPADSQLTLTRLPRSTSDLGVMAFDCNGVLHTKAGGGPLHPQGWFAVESDARDLAPSRAVRCWDEARHEWRDDPDLAHGVLRTGDCKLRLAGGLMRFVDSTCDWQGEAVLGPPAKGFYHHPYYALGQLLFCHKSGSAIRILACPWQPGDSPVDAADAHVLPLAHDREFPLVYGQSNGSVLVSTNLGGLYRFDGQAWHVSKPPGGGSYQLYSALAFENEVLLAHYPSGHLLVDDGAQGQPRSGCPPRLAGVLATAREAQSTMIYAGDLWVGVWPWAELWRYRRSRQRWEWVARLFDEPAVSDTHPHPYEAELQDWLGQQPRPYEASNAWGQRISGLNAVGSSLMVATSAKFAWPAELLPDFMPATAAQQYGQVTKVTVPGQLSVPIRWTAEPSALHFMVTTDSISVEQDGALLGQAPVHGAQAAQVKALTVTAGRGVFGRWGGHSIALG